MTKEKPSLEMTGRKVLVVAELGINHGGSYKRAELMVAQAARAGADVVKFQHYRPDEILGPKSPFLAEAKACQLTRQEHGLLKAHAEYMGLEWGVSLFHPEDVEWTEGLGMLKYKVASRAATNTDLLREINNTRKPVLVSTGLLPTPRDIEAVLEELGDCIVTLLYCVCDYPTPIERVDLAKLGKLSSYARRIGFSSHCPSSIPTICAVAKGAHVTENHVTCSRDLAGCDMASSLTFEEFGDMVKMIRTIERMP